MEHSVYMQTPVPRGGGTPSARMLVRRGIGRAGPLSGDALRSSDSLSDTKIFVLLAAIVFVFLLALGVAMTRVSRGRRRQQDGMRHHIVAASSVPQTLSKTILDTLPVFEVTDKFQLRQIRAQSPRVALNECFSGSYPDHEAHSAEAAADMAACGAQPSCVKSAQFVAPASVFDASNGGYALDSGSNSLCASDTSSCCGSDDVVLSGNRSAMELATYPAVPSAKGRGQTPSSEGGGARSFAPCSTPPAAFRYYGRGALLSASPSAAARCSVGDTRWGGGRFGGDPGMYAGGGTVAYRPESTQSLSCSPDRGTPAGAAAVQWPCEARLVHRSQPEISHCAPSPPRDGDSGLGSCPICLEEFEAGEQVRELPCLHRYHVVCIDTWLVSRSTCCPYCKLDIRRWYYGSGLDAGIAESGARGGGDDGLPGDAHGLAEEVLGGTVPAGGHRARRGRRLHRIPREHQGAGRLAQVVQAIRRTIV